MKTNKLLLAILVICSLTTISCKTNANDNSKNEKKSNQPNIVLLFVDDWGWGDVGYRNSLFETPNIDQLKKESLDFTRAYIPTPTCSPSRLSILTGKEAVRLQMVRHISGDPDKEKFSLWPKDPVQMPSINYLPLEEVTYAERLKEQGYYNMFVGKWHLGHKNHFPEKQGFDQVYGTTNAGHPKSYYYPYFKPKDDVDGFLKTIADKGNYLTDVLTKGATDFIEAYDKSQPFMLSFWYYNVHGPHIGKKEFVQKYLDKGMDKKYAQYGAMVEAMDTSVGKVREALKAKGIAENTVLILISDQGGAFSNAPLRGGKRGGDTLGEGGARVPFMILYPGQTVAGSESDTPVQSIDLYPTLVEIASGKKYEDETIQGKSLLPIIKGEDFGKRKIYFFRSYEDQYAAVIEGDWKLIKYHSGKYQLYNLKEDVSETKDLSDIESEKFNALKLAINKWEEEAVPKY